LNPRPADYESAALPLSYLGITKDFSIGIEKDLSAKALKNSNYFISFTKAESGFLE
jgi:hypothetical protein